MLRKRPPLLSEEAGATLVVGLAVGLIPEMQWWMRALGVVGTCVLALHTAIRMDRSWILKAAFPILTTGLLVAGTWRSIWTGFHDDFPFVTEEAILAKIIEACVLVVCGIAAYVFLLRPRSKPGYRVLPAQLMAFGAIVVAAGFVPVIIGLGWQFAQNRAAGVGSTGAPIFTVGPPRIPQVPQPALPPPQAPQAQNQNLLFSGYNLTDNGVTALAKELFKIRENINHKIELQRMETERPALVPNLIRACDLANVDCPENAVHPNSPDERGLMFYVADPDKPPPAAGIVKNAFRAIGVDIPFVKRATEGPDSFSLFVGRAP